MSRYDSFSREELIRRIEELEAQCLPVGSDTDRRNFGWFREKFSNKILDSIPDMLTVFTEDGTVVDLVSAEETNHAGLPVDKLIGSNLQQLLTPQNAQNLKSNLDNVFTSGEWSASHHNITLNGITHHYENRIFPLDDQHALCMCRDVTYEQQTREELETVKYALNNVDEEIYACDLEGNMIYANGRFRDHHSLTDGVLERKRIFEYWIPAGNRAQWQERVEKMRKERGGHKYTIRIKNEQGEIVVWDIIAYIIYDNNRKKDIAWFFAREATLRLAHESKLREINTIMDSILNNIPVYLFVKDPGNDFRYLYWNKAFEEHSGIPASQTLGRTDFEVFPNPRDAEKFRNDDLTLLRNGNRIVFQEEYLAQTGEQRVVTTSKALVAMEHRLPLIIGVSWDITEQKNAEAEIINARVKAEESDKLKSAFLANMSHEIRTPLNAIVGFAKLLAESDTEKEKEQYAEIIDSNSELLLQLINDILDLSKIEAGTLEFKFRSVDVNELCRAQYEVLRARVAPGVGLFFDEKYNNVKFVCDQNRLAQVLTNLLTNAIKFTEEGEIHFGFDLDEQMVHFYVRDTGKGIAADKLLHIFDRFVKLNNFAIGTGLGLSISKMIIEKLGGEIAVESEEGKGTCFRFAVPRLREEELVVETTSPQQSLSSPQHSGSWRVLVAEDMESNYLLLEALLGKCFHLIRARNGVEAVELFRQEHPDVVLMDMKMPEMDGYEATRLIRAEAPSVPIIAMTAFASEQDRERALAVGCSDYITKPLSLIELNRALKGGLCCAAKA